MDITRMGKTPEKTEKPKKMTAKEQSARFIVTARELKVDEEGERFSNLTKLILKAKLHS